MRRASRPSHREDHIKTLAFAGALTCSLLVATTLTPVRAADMTQERALNVSKEPHNCDERAPSDVEHGLPS